MKVKIGRIVQKIFRILRVGVTAIVLGIILVTYGLIHDTSHQSVHDLDYLANVVKIDPRIAIVAAYQKARYSTIAKEVAELQARLIVKVADEEGIPVELLVGLAEKESFFNSQLTSSADAGGLTQILVEAHTPIDEKQKYDIEYNLRMGCKILKWKLKAANGNYERALDFYSGHAPHYAAAVFERVGRFVVYAKKMEYIRNEVAAK